MSAFTDGDFSVAAVNGPRRIVFPFPRDRETFYTEQRWIQFADDYNPLALNTPDENDPVLFLVEEKEFNSLSGGIIEWTRVYSRIPKPRDDYGTFSYNFPGYTATISTQLTTPWALPSGTFESTDDPGRIPFTMVVTSRIAHSYFMVGANGQFQTVSDIPVIAPQRYVYGSGFGANAGGDLPDRLLWPASVTGVTNGTVPTLEDYKALVLAGTEIVAEASAIRNWMGNIWERATRYVVAK